MDISRAIEHARHNMAKLRRSDKRRHTVALCEDLKAAVSDNEFAQACFLARQLAGTGYGPKRRRYDTMLTDVPTVATWERYLSTPGPMGGCKAVMLYNEIQRTCSYDVGKWVSQHAVYYR